MRLRSRPLPASAVTQTGDNTDRRRRWEDAPPALRVVHEAVRGSDGIFAAATAAGDFPASPLAAVCALCDFGAQMDAPDGDGRTPLWIAVDRGEVDIVRYLIRECGASADTRDLGGWAPLHAAIERRDIETATVLVRYGGADVNALDNHGWTPLHAAAANGRLDMVSLMRELGAEVDTPNDAGKTALHTMAGAAWSRKKPQDDCCEALDAVKFLTGPLCKANVHATDDNGDTPLMCAAQATSNPSRYEVVHFLHEECGADVCVRGHQGRTPLHLAATDGNVAEVRYLVERGADPQARSFEFETPLHSLFCDIFTFKNHENISRFLETARFLVSDECSSLSSTGCCADVNARDGEGRTPLLWMLDQRQKPEEAIMVLQFLVDELGAEISEAADAQGNMVLHTYLDSSGDHSVVEFLLGMKGVAVDARNNAGFTPLHSAIDSQWVKDDLKALVKFLHKRGASVNASANDGRTPLHTAAQRQSLEVVKALVECGARLDAPDRNGLTAVQCAELYTHRTPHLPENFHYMADEHLRARWRPMAKYLRDAASSASAAVPSWWVPANLVGRCLDGDSQRALERFAAGGRTGGSSGASSRPHVALVVGALRVLESAPAYGNATGAQLRDLIAAGNLDMAMEVLMKVMAEKAAPNTHECPICFGPLHEEQGDEGKDTETEKTEIKEEPGAASVSTCQLVSCPNHHPMHAGCLADLLLGGNFFCPVCRVRLPVASTVDLRSMEGELFSGKNDLLFLTRPSTVHGTVALVECRARELHCDEHGDRGTQAKVAKEFPPLPRELLIRARDELLRTGQIDGALITKGPAALGARHLSSPRAFGIHMETARAGASDDNPGGATAPAEEEAAPDGAQKETPTAACSTACAETACSGFGRGLLDPRVQQIMLTGELARVKHAREAAQQLLRNLRTAGNLAEREQRGGEAADENAADAVLGSQGGLRRTQAEMRKRRAKQDRRDRGITAVAAVNVGPTSLGLARRELSEQSQQAIAALNDGRGIEDLDGRMVADASRGHRYLELAAPFRETTAELDAFPKPLLGMQPTLAPARNGNTTDQRSKVALRTAVANGEIDSAARHLRRGQISAHVHQVVNVDAADEGDVSNTKTPSCGKGGTKKQRKRQAALRRRLATQRAADALGHPVCCCCDSMVLSAKLKPPCEAASGNGASFVEHMAESIAEQHATCVNGHAMHAACFLRLVMAARPCPECMEPLVAPPVVSGNGEGQCCADGGGGGGGGGRVLAVGGDALLDARLDFMAMLGLRFDDEDEYGRPLSAADAEDGGGQNSLKDPLSDLRQCPSCHLGPLHNEDCSDLNYHHGECQMCGVRLCSRQQLDSLVADSLETQRKDREKKMEEKSEGGGEDDDSNELSVLEAVPNCAACMSQGVKSKVWYNGCMGCGLSFSSLPWESLPPYEPPLDMYRAGSSMTGDLRIPHRRAFLERVRRERRVARSVAALAEQLHEETVSLLHETRALADEQRRKATGQG